MVIGLALLVSLACYSIASRNRYARLISEAIEIVHREALVEVPERDLFDAAMDGMLKRLDANSGFISQDRFQTFDESINQEFVGVGMTVLADAEAGNIRVISPIPGSPAFYAGIRVGDRILEVDGKSTRGVSQEQAIEMIRGPKGVPVEFLIQRAEETEPLTIAVTRDAVSIPSVYGDTRNDDGSWNLFLHDHPEIGYIRLTQFGKRSADEMREALTSIQGKVSALILDLRNNPGGLLDKAIEISDMFIDREVLVVQTKQRDQRVVRRHYATGQHLFNSKKIPLVVLINQLSASAAEIVAACLQDYSLAVIVGVQSYGKGTVQDLIPLEPRRSILRLTTSSYWRPSGKNIDRTVLEPPVEDQYGVKPDEGFEVVLSDEDFERISRMRFERDQMSVDEIKMSGSSQIPWEMQDPQLKRAIDYLKTVTGEKVAA